MTTRVDQASRVIAASPQEIYAALVEAARLEAWLPPDGMSGRIEHFDARPGGGFRMVLTYLDPSARGKTNDSQDVVEVQFAELVPDERVVQRAVFKSDDPAFSGTMTMTWILTPGTRATNVLIRATDVPHGIDHAVHEAGLASSLTNLALHLEKANKSPRPN